MTSDDPDQPPSCGCTRLETRRRLYVDGLVAAAVQCLDCGRTLRTVPTETVDLGALPPWDAKLADRWQERIVQFYQRQRDRRNAEWWDRYEAHLNSVKWLDLRRRVFERCGNLCEGCAERRAVEVHHLSYAHFGDELLFELAALCRRCHERIHGRPPREQRKESPFVKKVGSRGTPDA